MANRQDKRGRSKNPEGQYAPLAYEMLRSAAWRSLSGSAIKVFLELHTRFDGFNNGELFLSLEEAAKFLGMGKSTAKAGFDELIEKGFLRLVKQGTFIRGRASTYRMTHKPAASVMRTDDWRHWKAPEKPPKIRKAWGEKKRKLPSPKTFAGPETERN